MALSFGFYADPALTTRLGSRLAFVQDHLAPAAADKVIYFGSPLPGKTCRANSSPGVAAITVSPTDAAPAAGLPASTLRLALSAAGLASATPGASLALPATVLSGVANAIPIHMRVLDSLHVVGVYNDLGLTTNQLIET